MGSSDIRRQVNTWLGDFEYALKTNDKNGLKSLFAETSYFRDNGAFTWDFRQFSGRDHLISILLSANKDIQATKFKLSSYWPEPQVHQGAIGSTSLSVLEAFADFETASGKAVAVLNAFHDPQSPGRLRVFALYTRLEDLKTAKPPTANPRGNGFTPNHDGETWQENHDRKRRYDDSDPEVLIVGSGQAGVMVAAHLEQLGVSPLIIDKNSRVGDNWYKRYDSLTLHNPLEMNDFPYLQFPKHYPEYLSKDLMGQWLAIYTEYMDLNVWTSTELVHADYDQESNTWLATIKRANGIERILRPRHIILATGGIGGKPVVPQLPGLSSFKGEVMHSSAYTKASDHGSPRRAVIVGAATSAHDIALDLYNNNVETTMLQRGPVVVVNMDTANLAYSGYIDPKVPTELVDIQYGIGLINSIREARSQAYHAKATQIDANLIKGLTEAGFNVGSGVKAMGWLDLFLRTGGGYYFNKGTSDIIIKGGIKVEQYSRLVEFVPDGVKLDDGEVIKADLVVLATGYQNRKAEVVDWFGEEVADKVGDIARLDEEGEWSNIWSQTGQRGLWFNGGGINQVRPGSRRLALLVKADLDGLITPRFRRRPKTSSSASQQEPRL
ncbi:flavin-binding monooxygenase [Fusarium mundagurra]|uniref:Flavin-binding monooxygenase n=1 Tax=Fusarium mundagurra TaxID=1567541 RepID=A0A8H5YE07_9HYPO|nr:flavin-binding monooxygenase [Fusarium mundagurra]